MVASADDTYYDFPQVVEWRQRKKEIQNRLIRIKYLHDTDPFSSCLPKRKAPNKVALACRANC